MTSDPGGRGGGPDVDGANPGGRDGGADGRVHGRDGRDGRGDPAAPTALELAVQELLAGSALTAFRLNGQYLSVAERLARPAGLTAAWWQVLGAVLHEPLPVAGIARAMGITRQSVQRIADLLVERGLATYEPNPAHRRAKLVKPTEEGRAAVAQISPGHAEFAARLAEQLGGEAEFAEVLAAQERLAAALEALEAQEVSETHVFDTLDE